MPNTLSGLPAFSPASASAEERMHWIQLPFDKVEALYDALTLKVQRNHMRRMPHADHLLKADLPLHANYLAVRSPDGAVSLIDGYTRISAVKAGLRPRPRGKVWLGVVDSDNAKQTEQMYLAVDSRQAVKTGRDAFEEGLRKAGLLGKLMSPVFVNGYAVSAVAAASGEADTLLGVLKLKKAIQVLDPLKLEVGRFALPSGALAGCLLLACHESDAQAVQQFTLAAARPDQLGPAERKLVPGALKFHAWLTQRREEGALSGKNVPIIMRQALGSYLWQSQGASGKLEPVERDAYLAMKR